MSGERILLHVVDHRLAGAPLRASLVRDAAAAMPEHAHLELAVGDGPGSGLPRVARIPVATRRAGREVAEAIRAEAPIAAAWAWSLDAAAALRDLDDTPRLVVVDRAPGPGPDPMRGGPPSPIEWAAWAPWLDGLPPAVRFGLEPIRPMPIRPGTATETEIERSARARESLREALGIARDARVVGVRAVGSSPIRGRSVRWDAFSIAALAVIARHADAVVIDAKDIASEGLRNWSRAVSIAPVVHVAPLRSEILEWIGALDALILAGDAADDADAALLPWIAGRAGVAVVAMDQEPWRSGVLDGVTGRLVPAAPPPVGCTSLLPILDDPVRRARMAAAWRKTFREPTGPTGGFTASLRGGWSVGVG